MAAAAEQPQLHFLVATFPMQGHINPGRRLAEELAARTGARVTFSTSFSGHRRMFPGLSPPDQEVEEGLVTYAPFSDGYDGGYTGDFITFLETYKATGSRNFAALLRRMAARGRPVTCAVYSMLLSWVADVARENGVPSSVHFWNQPATVFAAYYYYFHGYEEYITAHAKEPLHPVHLPGLPSMHIRDLPSFLTITDPNDPGVPELLHFRDLFETLDKEAEAGASFGVLVNTFSLLEPEAIACIDTLDLYPIGPLPGGKTCGADLFKPDERDYVSWLDTKVNGSVVYVSFGSLAVLSTRQMQEIARGLAGRPFLWVVRRDNRNGSGSETHDASPADGMVVEWCSQKDVLSHPSIGCFVTHCGWNSTMESLLAGVPMVCVPQMSDQDTIAEMVQESWGAGVRAEPDGEGVLRAPELRRCLDLVFGSGGCMRRRALFWKERLLEAAREGGSSWRNLHSFIEHVIRHPSVHA